MRVWIDEPGCDDGPARVQAGEPAGREALGFEYALDVLLRADRDDPLSPHRDDRPLATAPARRPRAWARVEDGRVRLGRPGSEAAGHRHYLRGADDHQTVGCVGSTAPDDAQAHPGLPCP